MSMKRVIALSLGAYRRIELYTVPEGRVVFILGTTRYSAEDEEAAKKEIDLWYAAKEN